MRIGLIASARYPIAEPFQGGMEKHTHSLATDLIRRGHVVTVFAAEGSDPALNPEVICDERCRVEFSEAALGDATALPEPFMRLHHAYLHLMLDLPERDFDLVHNSSIHYLPVAMAPSLGIPFLTTLHTPPTPWLESALAAQRPAPNCVYVSVSKTNARSWEHAVDVRTVIPNGVDLEAWPYSQHPEQGLVAWCGRIVPEKGPHLAVEAAHRAGRRVVLAGPVEGTDYEREVFGRLNADDDYAGHLDHAELARLMGSAEVLVCTPCWEEPFGLVVIEALACGTPVAAFDRGALSEIVTDSTGALAPAGDVAALAEAIGRASHVDRAACRSLAEVEYSEGAMVDRYEGLYAELVHLG